jgi:DNA primase
MISRWVNQATVQDIEFKSLLLDMEANDIRRRIKRGLSLQDAIPVQTRLREIQQEQRILTEQMHETGA